MADIPEWVKPGATLAVLKKYGNGYSGETITIEKVHKTGRFKVTGDDAQWTAWGNDASKRGYGRFDTTHATFLTDAITAKVAKEMAVDRAKTALRNAADVMEKLARGSDDDAIIAAAAKLEGGAS